MFCLVRENLEISLRLETSRKPSLRLSLESLVFIQKYLKFYKSRPAIFHAY